MFIPTLLKKNILKTVFYVSIPNGITALSTALSTAEPIST